MLFCFTLLYTRARRHLGCCHRFCEMALRDELLSAWLRLTGVPRNRGAKCQQSNCISTPSHITVSCLVFFLSFLDFSFFLCCTLGVWPMLFPIDARLKVLLLVQLTRCVTVHFNHLFPIECHVNVPVYLILLWGSWLSTLRRPSF